MKTESAEEAEAKVASVFASLSVTPTHSKLSDGMHEALQSVLRRRVEIDGRGRLVSMRRVLRTVCRETGATIFVKGGSARDIVSGDPVNDLDVVYWGASHGQVRAALKKEFAAVRFTASVKSIGLVSIGQGRESIDMTCLDVDPCAFDCTANSILIHPWAGIVLDMFGTGVADARARIWRIPPCTDRVRWVRQVRFPIWRMLKMRVRGFSALDEDMALVYAHCVDWADEHGPEMWGSPGTASLRGTELATMKIAIADVGRLRARGFLSFDVGDFVETLVAHGVLVVP